MKLKIYQSVALDFRSLALFRITIGLITLIDLIIRSLDLKAHYTDDGIFTRFNYLNAMLGGRDWSLYVMSGDWPFVAILFFLQGFFAIGLILGWRTTLCTFASWFFLVSLHLRNPLLVHGGDEFLKMMLFWGMFLPLGARASLDALLSNNKKKIIPETFSSWSSFALLAQISILYVFTAALKTGEPWRQGTAVFNTLSVHLYATPIGQYLLNFPNFLKFLTYSTLILEGFAPLLLFVPSAKGFFRILVFCAFVSFHFGLFLTMYLDIFPWVCMAAWTAVLPSPFWNYLQKFQIANRLKIWGINSQIFLKNHFTRLQSETIRYRNSKWIELIAGILIIYVFLLNVRTLDIQKLRPYFPNNFGTPAQIVKIAQFWRMFAPQPLTNDGWFIIYGTQLDGRRINILSPDKIIKGERPKIISNHFNGRRWAKFISELGWSSDVQRYQQFGHYLCKFWNNQHGGEKRINLIFMVYRYKSTQDSNPLAPPSDELKWKHHCFEAP